MNAFFHHLTVFQTIPDWRVLLDIFLLALAIHLLYRSFLATGTWKIALGLLVAVIGYGLATLLRLRGIEWIFSNLSQVTLIGLIILFQPEIRRVLEKTIHLRRRLSLSGTETLPGLLDDLLFSLAKRNWGALVVIPGKDPVNQWISGGLTLDGEPSIPLLTSIFDPNSPGHDGAVIIENNKVAAFGVRLPLSKKEQLEKDLGTRHHAAMGLSEETDALILLVSEERGAVRGFHAARMETLPKRGDVAARVEAHFLESSSYKLPIQSGQGKWRLGLELTVSLLLALFFWSTVILSRTETREMAFTVPIEYKSPPRNLVWTSPKPKEAKVYLEGPIDVLQSMDLTHIRVQVDLSDMVAGKHTVALTNKNVRVWKNLRVVDIDPDTLEIEMSDIHERELFIKPQFVGALPKGLTMAAIKVEPRSVRAFLPASAEETSPSSLLTTPIFLPSIRENTVVFCKIVAPADVQPADKRWPDVEVNISIVSK